MLHLPTLRYFDTSVTYPQWFRRVKFVVIPPRFVYQQYLRYIAIQPAVGCYNSSTFPSQALAMLTHWGRVTHICVGKLTIIVADNGLSPGRRQAIIWNNAVILLIGPLGTNFSEIDIEIRAFPLKKMHLKMSSAKWRLFCLGLNVLTSIIKV